jgi:hypothetical protein
MKITSYHNAAVETAYEASLELETWMTDANFFYAENYLEAETEVALNVADWMINESNFFPSVSLENEKEYNMELESWMIDAKLFSTAYSLNIDAEKALPVEEWMLNEKAFLPAIALEVETENALQLEAWMVNDSIFNSGSKEPAKAETLAMNTEVKNDKFTTIEYKDAKTGYTFLFKLAEIEEPKLKFERWMVDKKYWVRKQKSE